jgi:hypothetical protein
MDGIESVDVEVWTEPDASVATNVKRVGDGDTVGNAETLNILCCKMGLYVLVANPDETIMPA